MHVHVYWGGGGGGGGAGGGEGIWEGDGLKSQFPSGYS